MKPIKTTSSRTVASLIGRRTNARQYAAIWRYCHGQVTAIIPEPETCAMLLAGLGLLGFMAREKRKMI